MRKIAIITARGGSKRIPKKNIKEFCGKPIIAYSIEAALQSRVFDEVMVSTDLEEIKEIAEQYGAFVPFMRSSEASSDFATTADVIKEVLSDYEKLGKRFDSFACLYPTAPFMTAKRLVEASSLLADADAVLSVVKYSFPPQRAFVIRNGGVQFQYPQYERTRSQDLEPIYHDCGQFYMCKVDSFLQHQSLILPVTVPYIMPEEEVQDIDTMSDWEIAEAKYKVLHKGE
ncbi:pseudaminic acid cytidylyltransferase [Claveliimonas bilis]|uniref:pseudaminic acid cytidylyltransferase n=1 Tax=Claveliimonas bilis TaxID=3028070 RepID=UPI001E5DB40F|nr:pseudaminic acid cytidylyltransferase [Claveliimonas bilis]BCZ26070.1 pseudaminic acid cytidylyltransferase [Claveliimonas bilis]